MIYAERVELAAYQQMNIDKTQFDQYKEGRDEDVPHPCWVCFEEAFLEQFFLWEMRQTNLWEFLTLNQLSVHEYWFKFN